MIFQIMAKVRNENNYIATLTDGSASASSQTDKHLLIFDHFQRHIGSISHREHRLNNAELGWHPQQLQHLDLPFSEQEVEKTIKAMPREKAPSRMDLLVLSLNSTGTQLNLKLWQPCVTFRP
jgi:hypothetical protein